MMRRKKGIYYGMGLAIGIATGHAGAEVNSEELIRLGTDLTPLGAEKAGNEEGSIPAWEGGITSPPSGYKPGDHHPDPFASDPITFTITAQNVDQYVPRLSEGQQALLKTYASYFINVYPTHRSAAVPQRIYAATRKAAATAKLTADGNGITGAVGGIPFPIPKSGLEVIWNHIMHYRGDTIVRRTGQAAPTRGGDYTLVKFADQALYHFYLPGMTEERLENRLVFYRQEVLAPARLAGGILLFHEPIDQSRQPRQVWSYNPGQRRVRRAPHIAFDNPGTASDGMRTTDQLEMFNGSPERYAWKLIGKKEMYVPYNAYRLHSDQTKVSEILKPLHINPALCRYELHRVWVVEAVLKPGARHLYKRRMFYVDEDSWQILLADQYDNRDQLWRVSEGHVINYYDLPALGTTLEVHTDLQQGRYLAFGLDNDDPMYEFNRPLRPSEFTPAGLRLRGTR